MGLLNKQSFLDLDDLERKRVVLNARGDFVFVKALTALERDQWEDAVAERREASGNKKSVEGALALLVIASAVDDQGRPMFTEDDLDRLQKKSARTLGILADRAMSLSGITKEDLEALQKKSDAPTGDSPSA